MSEAEPPATPHPTLPAAFDLLGVVLAGGKSSRMGIDKATLPHPSSTAAAAVSYLDHAIARLRPLVRQVAVSGRPGISGRSGDGAASEIGLLDEQPELGPAMGVVTALRYAAAQQLSGVLVTPVDMPDITTEHLWQLAEAWLQAQGVVCASFDHQRAEPLLAVYPLAVLTELEQVLATPQRSLNRWIGARQVTRVDLPVAVARNVNRPEDL